MGAGDFGGAAVLGPGARVPKRQMRRAPAAGAGTRNPLRFGLNDDNSLLINDLCQQHVAQIRRFEASKRNSTLQIVDSELQIVDSELQNADTKLQTVDSKLRTSIRSLRTSIRSLITSIRSSTTSILSFEKSIRSFIIMSKWRIATMDLRVDGAGVPLGAVQSIL